MIVVLQLVFIGICMVGCAFFSGIETGIISIHRMRLRHLMKQGSTRAGLLQDFLDRPDRLLGTTLLGTNICVVAISVLGASLAIRWLGDWGEAVSTLVVSIALLVFCEYLPKAWFHSRPLERSQRFAGVLQLAATVLQPLSGAVVALTRRLVPGSRQAFSKPVPFVTREDLKVLAHEGERDGVLSARERSMIHRVFELSGKRATDIMTPRSGMTVVPEHTPLEAFFRTARESGFTRMPVCDKSGTTFVGIINVFNTLPSLPRPSGKTVADFARPPLFIRESMPVDDILPRLRRSRQPMCLVRNQAGMVTGLVTTEDILIEIVGKL